MFNKDTFFVVVRSSQEGTFNNVARIGKMHTGIILGVLFCVTAAMQTICKTSSKYCYLKMM